MLTHLRWTLFGFCVFLCSLTLCADEQAPARMPATLFESSGMQSQIEQVALAIGEGFDSAAISGFTGREYSEDALQRIRAGLLSAFSSQRLSAIVLSTIETELSDAEITAALEWLHSELGMKITALETARNPLTQADDRQRFFMQLRDNPPDANRLMVLDVLDKAWMATEASVSMMIDMQVAVSVAMMKSLSKDQRVSILRLAEVYEAQRGILTAHYKSETRLSMLYTYNGLSTDEIGQYAEFAQTPSGRHYVSAINLSLHKAMLDGSYALGRKLGYVLQEPAQSPTL